MAAVNPGPVESVSAAVAARRLRAVDAVSEALDRIGRLDGDLGAVVALRSEDALREAFELDRALDAGRVVPRPLCGVPTLVKDLEDVAGMPTRKGSLLLAAAPAARADGQTPGRLRRAGAIVVGKTALPEFATEGYTASPLTGVTRNPWDLRLSPGGSSGGSAAAIAAGLVPIATATDGGGSVRIPAAFCGLLGLKPTRGVISNSISPDWIDLTTDGPMATTVADLRVLLDVTAGRHVTGPAQTAPGVGCEPFSRPQEVLAACRTSPLGPLPADVADAFDAAVATFAEVIRSPLRWLEPDSLFRDDTPDVDWFRLASGEHVNRLGRGWVADNLSAMHPAVQEFMSFGLRITLDDYIDARRRQVEYAHRLEETLGAKRILLTPTIAVSSILSDGRLTADDAVGALSPETYSTSLQNITGHPALTLPAGYCGSLPFGLQLTGPWNADQWLLDLAALWEQCQPWPRVAPGYHEFVCCPPQD